MLHNASIELSTFIPFSVTLIECLNHDIFSRSQQHWKGQNESYNFLVSFDPIDSLRHICLFSPFPSNILCQADTLRNQDVSLVVCMYLVFFACRGGVIAGNSGLGRCGPAFNMWRQLFERNYFPLFVDSHEDTNTWLVCFFRKRTSGEKYQFCFQREGIVFSLCLCLVVPNFHDPSVCV